MDVTMTIPIEALLQILEYMAMQLEDIDVEWLQSYLDRY